MDASQQRFGFIDEVVLSVLAPGDVVAGIVWQGMEPVFADLDPETMSLTPERVTAQVTVHTKAVLVTPFDGIVGDWEQLRAVTEPRGIALQVEGEGKKGRWEPIGEGVWGMGSKLLRVDGQLISGGRDGFGKALAEAGIMAGRLPEWRGRRADYPGAAAIEDCVLEVENWREMQADIADCARVCARQASFQFEVRRPSAFAATQGLRRAG